MKNDPQNVFTCCNPGLPTYRRGKEVCRLFLFYCFPKQTHFLQAVPISFVPRPASQKNSRKTKCELKTTHFPRTMCHTKEREREIKGRRAWGKAGKSGKGGRGAAVMLPRDPEKKGRRNFKKSQRGRVVSCVTVNMQQAGCQLFQRI